MLRKIRIILALVFLAGITLLLVGIGREWWGWMASLQLLPSFLALNLPVMAGILILTLLLGRLYCSIICPMGVFQDIVIWLRRVTGEILNRRQARRLRRLKAEGKTRAITLPGASLGGVAEEADPHANQVPILGNVAGGLVILSSHPFSLGDFVEVSGTSGTVHEISLNHTKLVTPDGLMVMLPNKELASSQMINYSTLGRRRITWKVSASYDAPTETVKEACRRALAATEGILEDPAPSVYLTEYGSSSIEYTVYCWASFDDYWSVHFALGERLRETFAQAGVEMTYDHLNVHIVENRS